ncbi:MAG: hypothetical protein KAZ87_03840 [Spirochaetes bacterium]|nr:hypothetical protein [Spirochaetota bacterium]
MKFDNKGFFLLLILLAGIYIFVFGESGILERKRLSAERAYLEGINSSLVRENSFLRDVLEYHRNEILESERQNHFYLSSGEKVIAFENVPVKNEDVPKYVRDKEKVEFIKNLRIVWFIISVITLLFYFMKIKKEDTDVL